MGDFQLRDYQLEAVEANERELEAGTRAALTVMPTGVGKTEVFGELLRRRPGPHLVLAHTRHLVIQTADRLRLRTGRRVGVELGSLTASTSDDIIVGSVQSVANRLREARFKPGRFHTVVIDEAHRAVAPVPRKVADWLTPRQLLGFTAIPDRLDGKALGSIFQREAFRYCIRRAIEAGWLARPVEYELIVSSLRLDGVKTNARSRDLDDAQLEALMRRTEVLDEVVGPLIREAEHRSTIVFTAGVQHAHDLGDRMRQIIDPRLVAVVSGETPEAELYRTIDAYQNGDIQFVLNAQLLIEGFDAPATECVALARPTKSRARQTQCIGRALRTAPNKPYALILNFRPGDAHSLVAPIDSLAGDSLDDQTRSAALDGIRATRRPTDVLTALRKAENHVADLRAKAAAAEADRQRRAAEQRAELARRGFANMPAPLPAYVKTLSDYTLQGSLPFQPPSAPTRPPPGRTPLEAEPATAEQIEELRRIGVDVENYEWNAYEAEMWRDHVLLRRAEGLCTFRMAMFLKRRRFDPDMPFARAMKVIDQIKRDGYVSPTAVALAR